RVVIVADDHGDDPLHPRPGGRAERQRDHSGVLPLDGVHHRHRPDVGGIAGMAGGHQIREDLPEPHDRANLLVDADHPGVGASRGDEQDPGGGSSLGPGRELGEVHGSVASPLVAPSVGSAVSGRWPSSPSQGWASATISSSSQLGSARRAASRNRGSRASISSGLVDSTAANAPYSRKRYTAWIRRPSTAPVAGSTTSE